MSGLVILALRTLMALALYGFLGWALFLLWREIQREGTTLSSRHAPGIYLSIHTGESAQTTKSFSQPEVILGRDPGCDLPCKDLSVSTRHARLSYHHNQWWVMDLASTNGTYLNGSLVDMPTVITSGDILRCGNVQVHIGFAQDVSVSPTERLEKSK